MSTSKRQINFGEFLFSAHDLQNLPRPWLFDMEKMEATHQAMKDADKVSRKHAQTLKKALEIARRKQSPS